MKRNKETPIVLLLLLMVSTAGVVDGAVNLIANPGFESGTTSWNFYASGGGTFTTPSTPPLFEGTKYAKLTLSNSGTNIQLYQTGVALEANTRYNLSFAAYSNTGHDMTVRLFKHGAPYTSYMPDFTVDLGMSWQTFTTEFTSSPSSMNDGRLMFYFAQYAAGGDNYYIDAIVLEKVGLEPPIIITHPLDQTVTVGQSATFSVVATGTAPLRYQWQKNGTNIPGATSASYTTPPTVILDNRSIYRVNVTNDAGSNMSNSARLTVMMSPTAPTITTQPLDQTVTVGQSATFSVVATGTAPLRYQWQKNGTNIPGATSASYTTPPATLSDNLSTYRVNVTNDAGSNMSKSATMTVMMSPTAPTIITHPSDQTVTIGQSATFSVVATGTAPLRYQWQKNGTNIPGATSASYTTSPATMSDNGSMYRVNVTNDAGSVMSNSARLIVSTSCCSSIEARLAALETRVTVLETENTDLKYKLANVTRNGNDIYIDGANLHIRDGSNDTGGPVNGFGNLIIGYNEQRGWDDNRTGSHNLIIGSGNNYMSYGGLVAGYQNTVSGSYASVSGGFSNLASGDGSSISGGSRNRASGVLSSVSGGVCNDASGWYSSVSGGGILVPKGRCIGNTASGESSSVNGGMNNTASGFFTSVSGGYSNIASGDGSSVSGGSSNTASYSSSSVSGGSNNIASGSGSSVSGGNSNTASGGGSSVSGGYENTASGFGSSVSGGNENTASNSSSSVSGGNSNIASGEGSSVSGGGPNANTIYKIGNTASGQYSSVSGGLCNKAIGYGSSVSGGGYGGYPGCSGNTADGYGSSVSGGGSNIASGVYSSVSGGYYNTASGGASSINGGNYNIANGDYASISGGRMNKATGSESSISGGELNTASGWDSSVSGGELNTASGYFSSISGGWNNTASNDFSSVGGGELNTASGPISSVSGGKGNIAAGKWSSVSGGLFRTAMGDYDWVAGLLFQDQ